MKRDVTATGPNQLWVTDLIHVPIWPGRPRALHHPTSTRVSTTVENWANASLRPHSRASSTPADDRRLAGRQPNAHRHGCWTRSRWPWNRGGSKGTASTATPGRSSRRSAMANGSPGSAPPRRAAPSAALVQRSRRERERLLQGRVDPPARPPQPRKDQRGPSSSRPWVGYSGTTPAACTAAWAIFPPPNTSRPTTLPHRANPKASGCVPPSFMRLRAVQVRLVATIRSTPIRR